MHIPIRCNKSVHSLVIDGGLIRLPNHTWSTFTLTMLLRAGPRCGRILAQYCHGAAFPREILVQTPHYVRHLLSSLFWAPRPLEKALQANRLFLEAFFSLESDPFVARLALGIPPSDPILIWSDPPDPSTDLEWSVIPDWDKTLSRLTNGQPHRSWGWVKNAGSWCACCETPISTNQLAVHATSTAHLATCEAALTNALTEAGPLLPRLGSTGQTSPATSP